MTVTNDTTPQARVVGSNYTTINWRGQPIAYLEAFVDGGQAAFGGASGAGYDVIHPLGFYHPAEVATGRVVGPGTITFTIRELWRRNVWEHLAGLTGTRLIAGPGNDAVFTRLARMGTPAYVTRIITAPDGFRRGDVYHNVTVYGIPDGDQVTIDALTTARNITALYTHKTPL